MDEKEKLPIPVNIPEQRDLLPGIGGKELGIIGIAAAIDIGLILFINGISGSIVTAILVGAALITTVIMAIKRDRFNESIIDKILIIYRFSGVQKKFMYEFYDMYHCGRGDK